MIIAITIILYFAIVLFVGWYAGKKVSSTKAYDGIGLGVLLCVFAGAGEWTGGTSITGVSEYGFVYGLSGAWYTIANALGVCFLAICFVKLYRSLDTPTVSGIMGAYIGNKAKVVASAMLIIVMMAVGISQMEALGSICEALFGLGYAQSIIVIGIILLAYTVLGGMMSVAYTNVIHLVVLYIGMIGALIFCFFHVGDIQQLTMELPASYFSMTSIGMPKVSSWILASVLGACTAQASLQPILAAKDEKTAVRSSFIIAAVVAPFGIIMALIGMYAKVAFPELESGKQALVAVVTMLPDVMSGVVMAAAIAAILSTASPIFLSCSTLFTRDIYGGHQNQVDDKMNNNSLNFQRLVTIIVGAICMIAAIALGNEALILEIVYFAYGIRGSLFVVLLFAIYWKKVSPNAAITAMIMTGIVSVFWVGYQYIFGVYPINANFTETYAGIITAAVITVVGSLLLRGKNKYEKDNN